MEGWELKREIVDGVGGVLWEFIEISMNWRILIRFEVKKCTESEFKFLKTVNFSVDLNLNILLKIINEISNLTSKFEF